MNAVRQHVEDGRDNVIVVYHCSDAPDDVETVLWEVHQDTVGVKGMRIDPFAGHCSEGRIYGRGACDVKGSMAAMLAALVQLQAEAVQLPHNLVVAFTINEEAGFSGVKALQRLWGDSGVAQAEAANLSGDFTIEQLRAFKPSRALVAEPTLLDVVVAHKGSLRWRCHTHGRAAHTSRPEQGVNAISTMVRVVQAIERYQAEVLDALPSHELCGPATVCVSTIRGGSGVNTVPDHVVIDIDRRLMPGESPDAAYQELIDYIDQQLETKSSDSPSATIEHEPPASQSTGLQDTHNRAWAEQIAATVHSLGLSSELIGVPYGTDAWALDELGIPTVVFGPGSIDQAHTDDEWIDVQQLEHAVEIYCRLALGDKL